MLFEEQDVEMMQSMQAFTSYPRDSCPSTFMRLCETYLKEKKEFSKDAELFFLCLDEHSKTKQRRWFEALQNTIIYSLCRVHMELGNSPLHTPL
jgi:hypothetical protein